METVENKYITVAYKLYTVEDGEKELFEEFSRKVEYSQIVRRKLKSLRACLTSEFGTEVSRKSIKQITDAARGLEDFEERGISVSSMMA